VDPAAILASAEQRSMALSDLLVDSDISCRAKIHDSRVRLMVEALRTGGDLAPLVAAVIDDTVTLIDGHHRYWALLAADIARTEVLVLTGVTKREEARWIAFWLHWRAALPLTRAERRAGLSAYIEAGHHHATRFGRLKTYRDISADLGIPRSTLWHWLREDFPAIAARMAKEPEEAQRAASSDGVNKRLLRTVAHHADQLALLAKQGSAVAEEAREALRVALRRCGDKRPLEAVLAPSATDYCFT
jgi:ParB-like chromosome segregation protein Spo0J